MKLSTLKRQVQQATSFRGHRMQWASPLSNTRTEMQFAECKYCKLEVGLLTHPMPNEIDISGPAVALNCTRPISGPSINEKDLN